MSQVSKTGSRIGKVYLSPNVKVKAVKEVTKDYSENPILHAVFAPVKKEIASLSQI